MFSRSCDTKTNPVSLISQDHDIIALISNIDFKDVFD